MSGHRDPGPRPVAPGCWLLAAPPHQGISGPVAGRLPGRIAVRNSPAVVVADRVRQINEFQYRLTPTVNFDGLLTDRTLGRVLEQPVCRLADPGALRRMLLDLGGSRAGRVWRAHTARPWIAAYSLGGGARRFSVTHSSKVVLARTAKDQNQFRFRVQPRPIPIEGLLGLDRGLVRALTRLIENPDDRAAERIVERRLAAVISGQGFTPTMADGRVRPVSVATFGGWALINGGVVAAGRRVVQRNRARVTVRSRKITRDFGRRIRKARDAARRRMPDRPWKAGPRARPDQYPWLTDAGENGRGGGGSPDRDPVPVLTDHRDAPPPEKSYPHREITEAPPRSPIGPGSIHPEDGRLSRSDRGRVAPRPTLPPPPPDPPGWDGGAPGSWGGGR